MRFQWRIYNSGDSMISHSGDSPDPWGKIEKSKYILPGSALKNTENTSGIDIFQNHSIEKQWNHFKLLLKQMMEETLPTQ